MAPVESKRRGHRRRLLERLSRISSSPQLSLRSVEVAQFPDKHSVSCVSLSANNAAGVRVVETVEIPYGTEGESLRISVPSTARRRSRRDLWSGLPDEVKVGVLRWLEPRELVRVSVVSCSAARLKGGGGRVLMGVGLQGVA